MIISWNWLKEYVDLDMSVDELTDRLTLTGLNLEGVEKIGADVAIDLEVTSNRPDCLGHIGVAREVAVIWQQSLREPAAEPPQKGAPVQTLASVEIAAPQRCHRYTARVIRGIKIGPSPAWLANRLQSLGIAVINNVVDISNYVMMECGQPLHTFDFEKLADKKIIVRESKAGEIFTAINHHEYELPAGACVIADSQRAVALGGVMGGADTEVTAETTDLLIEAASFDPLSVRNIARKLNLHSPSSYRFERGVDPDRIDWASRRCCELILELAGGELATDVIDMGSARPPSEPVKLRFEELPRILGIEVPTEQVQRILGDLGCKETHICDHCVKVVAPSWRADLTREIDLIEEIARIHGYDRIPEDAGVKMVASTRTPEDRVLEKVRNVLVATGFDEAMTVSAVDRNWVDRYRPWSQADPLTVSTPVLRRADCLRQTLIPSLLYARLNNEKLFNSVIELFEIASIYLPCAGELPDQRRMLAITSGRSFTELKGVLETLVETIAPDMPLAANEIEDPLFAQGCELKLGDQVCGVLGEVSQEGLEQFELRSSATVAELDLGVLGDHAVPIRRVKPLSAFPPVRRDLNIVVNQDVCWADIERIVISKGADVLESILFQDDSYRDPKQLGEGKKSVLFSIQLRSASETLTNEQADAMRDQIVAALGKEVDGKLRA
ncbi:MAG TPA: phenylalanine--tRNA ligase subunit beta [Planctomycetaceae bacterium]|nr:phenylalanine--tRNA ligase subunit beta [Planctomycetaceae bacterium]